MKKSQTFILYIMWKAGLREFSKLFVVVEVVEGEGVVVGGEVSCLVTAGRHSPDRQCLPLEHVVPCHSDSEHHNLFDMYGSPGALRR